MQLVAIILLYIMTIDNTNVHDTHTNRYMHACIHTYIHTFMLTPILYISYYEQQRSGYGLQSQLYICPFVSGKLFF
ncbi:hypothetical protein MtrunA17_Chr1g0178841 [Medicago truncatula]|uniref:Uncharacterized protein n=1 Tax=Medicago truncatula TaxID=3880 RepID=A0A396JTB9_MEDTR|nr:hypothetical protein MtrunA17_Chr1g0178841 [Medicago truncatula]